MYVLTFQSLLVLVVCSVALAVAEEKKTAAVSETKSDSSELETAASGFYGNGT